jgi:hypothetical protein
MMDKNSHDDEDNLDDLLNIDELIELSRPGILDLHKVPPEFHHLIPLAEIWGISDDVIRWEVVDRATKGELEDLIKSFSPYDAQLDNWLGGLESYNTSFSREYIAFTNLRMAFYAAKSKLKRM